MNVIYFLCEMGLLLIIFFWITGYFIKRKNFFRSELIPLFLLFLSFIITPMVYDGFSNENSIRAISIASISVMGHQIFTQSNKLIYDNENDKIDYGDGQSETENTIYNYKDRSKD